MRLAKKYKNSTHNCVGPKTITTANYATETWAAKLLRAVTLSRRKWALADVHLFFWQVLKPCAICVAQDPRKHKPRVSLRAFRRTRVIWFVVRPQKRRTTSGGEVCAYLDQALFCERDVTRLCTRDGGMSQVWLKPGIVYK